MFSGKFFRIAGLSLAGAALVLLAGAALYRLWEREPELAEPSPAPSPMHTASSTPAPTEDPGSPFETRRQDGVYTLLLVGNDDGNGNTDTILLGRLDTRAHSLNLVSIPRDTLINEDWTIRKINAVYWGDVASGGSGIDALQAQLARLTGFEADCYGVVDLDVFMEVVDAMGGVWFDVPQALDYEDPWQDLYIHLQPGYQRLGGYEAMGLCRYRSGYADGDLGRIEMQHQFLSACADQFLSLGKIPNVKKVVSILSEGLETNLSAANIAYFIRQFLQCDAENIRFFTAPNHAATIQGYSYAVLEPADWLPMVNEYLNPYHEPVTADHVDLVYREGGSYACTGTLRGAWYYSEPAPAPAPAPPSAAPEPEEESPPAVPPEISLPEYTLPTPPPASGSEMPPFLEIPGNIGNIEA